MLTKRNFLRMGIILLSSLGFIGSESASKWRYVKILQSDKSWKRAEFNDVKKWDWFRIFDPNGKPSHWDLYQKEYVYQTDCHAFPINEGPSGNWAIRISKCIGFES